MLTVGGRQPRGNWLTQMEEDYLRRAHVCQGGKPSPVDRMLAARFGVMSAEKLMTQILEYSNVAGQSHR